MKLWALLGIIAMLFGLFCAETAPFALAQTGTNVSGIIFSNTTWSRANSPYTLTGPTAVNTGVTLTIEPGVSVNINGYYIQVNGTLTAIGSASNIIQINNGLLHFTPVSVRWNDQTNTGCMLQYVNLINASISAVNALKLDHGTISGGTITLGDASAVTNNNMGSGVTAGKTSTIASNQINGSATVGDSSKFLNNKIQGSIYAGDSTTIAGNTIVGSVICNGSLSQITNNIIGGSVTGGTISNNTITANYGRVNVQGTVVSNNIITGGTVSASSQITNNIIVSGNYTEEFRVFGGYATATENTPAITGTAAGAPVISGNTIKGGGWYRYMFIFYDSTTIVPAIDLSSGSASAISSNIIIGDSGLAINGNFQSILGNSITGDVNGSAALAQNNTIYGSLSLYNGTPTISNNTISSIISVNSSSWNITGNTVKGITESQGNGYISDNYVIGAGTNGSGTNSIGINILSGGTIQRNYVANNTFGIVIRNSLATVSNNTITNNGVGIALYSPSLATTINYNNIQSNNQNIVLESGTANNVDATYNWWGTSSAQAIGQTIYDYKNDFNLGNVTYIPFLTTTNSKAMPNLNTQIPTPSPTPLPTPSATPTPSSSPTPSSITTSTSSPTTTAAPTSAPTDTPIISPTPTPTTTPTDTAKPATTLADSPSPTQIPVTINPEPSHTVSELPAWIILIIVMVAFVVIIVIKKNPARQITR